MNKTLLIVQREYLTRVRNKTFLLTTLLTPLVFVILIGGSIYFSVKGKEQLTVAVIDANGFLKNNLQNSSNIKFEFPAGVDTTNYLAKGYTAILIVPPLKANGRTDYIIRSKKGIGMSARGKVEDQVNDAIEDHLLQQAGVRRAALDSIHHESQLGTLNAYQEKDGSAKESNQGLAYGIGYASGFLIYLILLIYGMMLMRGVMEEKTSRIAEVIISSVKPFQLMLGKIIGIGAVGLTQFLLWVVLIVLIYSGAHLLIAPETLQQVNELQQNGGIPGGGAAAVQASEAAQRIYNFQHVVSTANWTMIIGCFVFYFIGGYLFYAALFAAVGSAVEDAQNSQGLTMPLTTPIIFSFVIMASAINSPDSPLAVWASMIPFSSPIVMMARVAYGVPGTVPYWQLATSMGLLVLGFVFTTWLSAKIYRTGILLYGKKVTWKEMIRWGFRKA